MYFVPLCLDFGLQTFSQADSNGDGKVDPEEWEEFVKKNPAALRNMSLPYLQ
jgi:serine/threonine-protein phosphatase 2B regulatory subunit